MYSIVKEHTTQHTPYFPDASLYRSIIELFTSKEAAVNLVVWDHKVQRVAISCGAL